MHWVEGPVLRTLADAELFPDLAERRAIAERVVDTLVAIRCSIPIGLGELARRSDYVARQLRRWRGQWGKAAHPRAAPDRGVGDRLAARIPSRAGDASCMATTDSTT